MSAKYRSAAAVSSRVKTLDAGAMSDNLGAPHTITFHQHMPRNIEIKARIKSVEQLKLVAASLSGSDPVEILQDDTFFTCEAGRLKLRAFADGSGVLIFYQRADEKGPKESFFTTALTHAPDALRDTLALAYGQSGRVKKHRTLFTAGRTRIHLDRVDGLGDYLELEVMLADNEAAESGHQEAYAVMASLGVQHSQLVASAYVDLLTDKIANQEGLGQISL